MQAGLWICLVLPLAGGDGSLAPWAANRHASDVPRREVQQIAASKAEYSIEHGGTMDGRNCRTPQGVWQPFVQTWESNRLVRLENVGPTDLVNPWLDNGRNDFRSLKRIVDRAVKPGMSDKEKVLALWWQEIQHRFHWHGDNQELSSPVKVFNVYGHNTCGNDSICLAGQWKQAGLKVAPARVVGHCVTQVFFDGGWRLLDGDMHSFYLLRDNETIAGEQDLVRDHDLVKRTHTQGLLQSDRRAGNEWASSVYVFEGEVVGDRNAEASTSMDMTLRPGEAIVWRWGRLTPVKYHGPSEPKFPDQVCNGLWEYRPDFAQAAWRRGATVSGVVQREDGLAAADGGGSIIWKMHSPYVFVGGRLEVEAQDAMFAISWDGKKWEETGSDLDAAFPPAGPARYSYFLRCELKGEARLRRLAIINDLQMAPLTLPGMEIGENKFAYSDESPQPGKVQITHEWVERSASRLPAAPTEAIGPTDGGEAEGTSIVFRWQTAADPDGHAIADYHFELSAHADMRHPLSPTFTRLVSRTADAGQPRFTLKEPGQLTPDRSYYWRVRAQDSTGVWGPWSKTWSFTPRGPGVPLNVTLDVAEGRGVLHWSPSSQGRRSAAYRIYASDEKGFSISDKAYQVSVGTSQELPGEFSANFVAEVQGTQLAVVGSDVSLAGANKAFYRVVAVDAAGNRSGPSDYVAAPRPLVVSPPPAMVNVGKELRHTVRTIRSLGDLRMRLVGGKETTNYWDVERPKFKLVRGPDWLSIDADTGLLSGTPAAAGKVEVVVAVSLERDLRRLDGESLKWGVEKVVASGTDIVGRATQRFVLDVQP